MNKEITMQCEEYGCKSTKGNDYNRKPEHESPLWNGEPIFLCEKHAYELGYSPTEKVQTN